MKNLEKFGVQELTTVEQRELEGGWWIPVARWVGGAIAAALISQDLDSLGDAFNAGYNDVRNKP
jgi:hypothetical protein